MPTIEFSNIGQSKIGTSCMICGEFVELNNSYSSKPQICDECKETIQFVKQNRSAIERILKKDGEK